MNTAEILKNITDFYLESSGFNGISAAAFLRDSESKDCLSELINSEQISIVYGDYHPNPHIKALHSEPFDEQVKKMDSKELTGACIYPCRKHLLNVVDQSEFSDSPYTLCLKLGDPQLSHKSFDLSILEIYRNDPRYSYQYSDIAGYISISDEYYESDKIKESDQILLESFGFSFDDDLNIYVAVFLRYLTNLSPEHQQIWESKQVDLETHLHPDFHRSAIIGDFPERLSLYEAVLMEIGIINEMSVAMDRKPLFKEDFGDKRRPREFGYLVRPTLKEFNDFVHLLDKMLSENINRKFFKGDVSFEFDDERNDGKIIVRQKGSIQILNDWLRAEFKTEDWAEIDEMIGILKRVRKIRQKPAHSIRENEFDNKYIVEQRGLMKSVYRAVKIIRVVLSYYPHADEVEINAYLNDGKIWMI